LSHDGDIGKSEKDVAKERKKALYRTIYEDQKGKILGGQYSGGEMVPCEREMCDHYGVDRITVRKALDMLVADGLLEKRAGLGSFVKAPMSGSAGGQNPSRNILFVMSKNSNDISSNPSAYNSELFYAIEQECRRRNHSLFYAVLDGKGDVGSITNGNSFAAILFVSYVARAVLDRCAEMRLPALCINNRHDRLLSIVPEDERGSYQAVRYLQSMGHRRIAVLLGRPEYYSTQERLRGFHAAMREAGLPVDPRHVLNGDWTFNGARTAVLGMLDGLERPRLPTALFCCSDIMAIGAMDALKERRLAVPEDMSVMGFDNVQQSLYVSPRLSTVSVDLKLMARLAVEEVCRGREERPAGGYLILIPAVLEERQSVAAIETKP